MEFNNGTLTFSLPELSTIATWQWVLMGLSLNAVYGLITHYHSLPSIKRWNKNHQDSQRFQINDFELVELLVYRLFLSLPGRIVSFALGLVAIGATLIASGKLKSNVLIRYGWHWHLTPSDAKQALP